MNTDEAGNDVSFFWLLQSRNIGFGKLSSTIAGGGAGAGIWRCNWGAIVLYVGDLLHNTDTMRQGLGGIYRVAGLCWAWGLGLAWLCAGSSVWGYSTKLCSAGEQYPLG